MQLSVLSQASTWFILEKLKTDIDAKLRKQQVGFRSGRSRLATKIAILGWPKMIYVMKSCWERPTWKAYVEVGNRVCSRSTYFRHTMRKLASFLITQNWSSFYPPNFDWHANTALIQPRVSRLYNMHVSWTLKRLLIQYGRKAYSTNWWNTKLE